MNSKARLRSIVGGSIGNLVEWYDWYVYSAFALTPTYARIGVAAPVLLVVAVATVFGLTAGGTLAFFLLVQPLVGLLSDRVGRRPVLIAFGVLGTLGTVPVLTALESAHSETRVLLLLGAALLAVSGYTAINAVVKAELFPTEIRALGVGLPYAIAVSLFGGTAEYLALRAKHVGHERWFYWYVTFCVAMSLVVYATMRETRETRLVEE